MPNQISVHQAEVRTATVQIKTLTVGGKQVTLAVFRQLKNVDLLDGETGELMGQPWGTVNYFWGACTVGGPHLHAVWQRGDELRRSCVTPLRNFSVRQEERDYAAGIKRRVHGVMELIWVRRRRMGRTFVDQNMTAGALAVPFLGRPWQFDLRESSFEFKDLLRPDPSDRREIYAASLPSGRRMETPEEAQARLSAWRANWERRAVDISAAVIKERALPADMATADEPHLVAYGEALAEELDDLRLRAQRADAKWAENYKQIEALPQLFIAV